MIIEIAMLQIQPGKSAEFEQSFAQAQKIIAVMRGYLRHSLSRCLEDADKYMLLVEWQTLQDHTEGFRQSREYQEWKRLLHHFYDPFPTVEHFEPVVNSSAKETLK